MKSLYAITTREERTGALAAKNEDLVYRKKEWFVPVDFEASIL